MAIVTFYEKPGCRNNSRQKALLRASGHQLEVHDLLTTPWTAETLRSFFGARPVAEWVNPAAPAVKAGEIVPTHLTEDQALALMLQQPILIRRPLIEVAGVRRCGFDVAAIREWIGLVDETAPVNETCVRAEPCSGDHSH